MYCIISHVRSIYNSGNRRRNKQLKYFRIHGNCVFRNVKFRMQLSVIVFEGCRFKLSSGRGRRCVLWRLNFRAMRSPLVLNRLSYVRGVTEVAKAPCWVTMVTSVDPNAFLSSPVAFLEGWVLSPFEYPRRVSCTCHSIAKVCQSCVRARTVLGVREMGKKWMEGQAKRSFFTMTSLAVGKDVKNSEEDVSLGNCDGKYLFWKLQYLKTQFSGSKMYGKIRKWERP